MAADEALEEAYSLRTLRKRGHHKIFLGYAAGVGKTYTMLAEAHRRGSRGEDIVIGFVETHGRKETAALVEGLERVPPKLIEYRGKEFKELDTDAVIARRPKWVLVDELAHTNMPGTRHEKRWQCVEEILDAGINVISTVNIQHLESLNDTVYNITGVRVRETVPDGVLDEADEVVLVDIPPDALINRLRRGASMPPRRSPGAGQLLPPRTSSPCASWPFARPPRRSTSSSNASPRGEEALHPWAAEERIIVCSGPARGRQAHPQGHRLAKRFQGRFWVLHVRTHAQIGPAGGRWSSSSSSRASWAGRAVEVEGDSVGEESCTSPGTTAPPTSSSASPAARASSEIVRGSRIARIIREIDHADVLVVADPSKSPPVPSGA